MNLPALSFTTLLFFPTSAAGQEQDSVQLSLLAFQKMAAKPDAMGFRLCFTAEALEDLGGRKEEEVIGDMAELLAHAKVTKVLEEHGRAVAVFQEGSERREVLLQAEGDQWRFSSARSYLVKGKDLSRRTGRKPVPLELEERSDNGPYGDSAFSFAYVTADPGQCKNRFDLWYCHNQRLHARGAGRIADLGKASLTGATALPVGANWERRVDAVKGHSYVLRCRDRRDRDFFVRFKIKKIQGNRVFLQWTLLSTGFGAPETIREAHPLESNAGNDGLDGLCPKGG